MAFTNETFSGPSTGSPAPRMYTYRTNDDEAAVEAVGYFNSKVRELQVGDLIYIHLDADGTQSFELTAVTANDGSVVTIQGLFQISPSA